MLIAFVCQSMSYIEIAIAFFSFLLLCYFIRNQNGLPINWPLLGMLPSIIINLQNINDYLVEVAEKTQLTFLFRGAWFGHTDFLLTVDPTNVNYITSKNFGNFPKGTKYKEIFEVFGDGLVNSDFSLWESNRRSAQSFFFHPRFNPFLVKKIWEKVGNGLIPVLDQACNHGLEVDLQDLFKRFTLDIICTVSMDCDPRSLSIQLPEVPLSKALDDVEEAIVHRYVVPTCVWKFERWLGVGLEKKYREAWETLDSFMYKCISRKREELSKMSSEGNKKLGNEMGINLMTLFYKDETKGGVMGKDGDKLLRDMFLNFLIAGRDTTSAGLSWFFYLLIKNPHVLSKIKEELESVNMQVKDGEFDNLSSNFEELNEKVVYLHGAMCEALRLYPPVPFEAMSPVKPDILPSGQPVDPKTQVIINLYVMARMKSIWGEDCCEFKPERWISEKGKIKHEPTYKFFTFSSGPRNCLGKNVALTQMKAIAATIIQNYQIQLVEGHPIVPDASIILGMKHGFKVKVLNV